LRLLLALDPGPGDEPRLRPGDVARFAIRAEPEVEPGAGEPERELAAEPWREWGFLSRLEPPEACEWERGRSLSGAR